MSQQRWHPFATPESLRQAIADKLCAYANACITERGVFTLVLAGGETPRTIYAMLRHCQTDWQCWQVYFGDERCLPEGDPQRNDSMACSSWLDHVPLPTQNIHRIPADKGAAFAVPHYAQLLAGVPLFDLVLLGLGEDAHTASLFPGHDWGALAGSPAVLAVSGAPKPPTERITLSAQRLGMSRAVWFIVSGKNKQEALRRWRAGEPIPASAVNSTDSVDIFFDCAL